MSLITPDVWKRLEQNPPIGDNLTARQADPSGISRLQCAIDAEGRRHLLIALHEDEEGLRDTRSRGIVVETRDLVVRGNPPTRYIDIQCLDVNGYPAFDLIGGELARELSQPGPAPSDGIKQVLTKWRRFWGQLPSSALSKEEVIGLFAELWFFLNWLMPVAGPSATAQRWRGPMGSRHDYEWAGKSIEVKGTTSIRGQIHWINGLDQLSQPENGELYLFSLHLREEVGATNTLPVLIGSILLKMGADDEALNRFETALAQTGYSPAHDDEYAKLRLRVVSEALYAVALDFPRLEEKQFVNGVLAGVERVEYEINLSGFEHLILARKPEELDKILKPT